MASVVALLALVFLAVGCGPSFQAVYESDVHFEHCYALDQSAAPTDSKRDCWKAWLHAYTYGQPRDRVDYASARFVALTPDEAQSIPKVAAGAAARSTRPAIDAPVPTNAFAPPPNIASAPIGDSGVSSADAALSAPGIECADACAGAWQACRRECSGAACTRCDNTYRACMPACFADKKPTAQ